MFQRNYSRRPDERDNLWQEIVAVVEEKILSAIDHLIDLSIPEAELEMS